LAGVGLILTGIIGITQWTGTSSTAQCTVSSVENIDGRDYFSVAVSGYNNLQAISWTGATYATGDSSLCTAMSSFSSVPSCCTTSWKYNKVLWFDFDQSDWDNNRARFLKFSISGGVLIFAASFCACIALLPLRGPMDAYYPVPNKKQRRVVLRTDDTHVNLETLTTITNVDKLVSTKGKKGKKEKVKKPNSRNININDPKAEIERKDKISESSDASASGGSSSESEEKNKKKSAEKEKKTEKKEKKEKIPEKKEAKKSEIAKKNKDVEESESLAGIDLEQSSHL